MYVYILLIKSGASQDASVTPTSKRDPINPGHKDNSFREFRRLCAGVADNSSYLDKSSLVRTWLTRGTGDTFQASDSCDSLYDSLSVSCKSFRILFSTQ